MIPDLDQPAVTGEAAAIPALAEIAEPSAARAAVAVRCRVCGFGWVTYLPVPTPCVSCHVGWKECAGHVDETPLVLK